MEDLQIVQLYWDRDQQAIACSKEKYGIYCFTVANHILDNFQDSEECVSDIYLRVWEKFASFDRTRGSLAAWLTAVARNAAVDRRRRSRAPEQNWEENEGASPSPEDEVLRRERTRQLRQALDTLGSVEQLLFYRKYYYLQSTAQIAAEMGLSERAVEGRLYRLRRRLQKAMGGDA